MPHQTDEQDWDDEYDAEEGDFGDPSDDEPTVACPYCGHEIHEDAYRCSSCENYLSKEDSPPARKSWFIIVGTIVTLLIVYWWIRH